MRFAKVVFGLAVEGPFDYEIPFALRGKISPGSRVEVNFRNQRKTGYVVELIDKSNIKGIKPISCVLDEVPLLDKTALRLTQEVSRYYCCSWGEAIESSLPAALRKNKFIPGFPQSKPYLQKSNHSPQVLLVHDLNRLDRWDVYSQNIQEAIGVQKSVIFLSPNIDSLAKAQRILTEKIGIEPTVLLRKESRELDQWLKVKNGQSKIVIGVRSAIFAPLSDLGLVIIDEEHDSSYKQDQAPHYHAREVAFMRINIQKAKLIMGSSTPSLESFYLYKKNKIQYEFIPRKKAFPETRILNTRSLIYWGKGRKIIFSKYLEDAILTELSLKGKILLFMNRKGFSTYIFCQNCAKVLKCPRCNINLIFHFSKDLLYCHYCNFKMSPPKICPDCNSGYIKYSGLGQEKIESELNRLFPQAKIKIFDEKNSKINLKDADIFILTQSAVKHSDYQFGLVALIAIDDSLGRIDFRSGEKTFALLCGLWGMTEKKMVIQTNLPHHHCFKAIENKNPELFYEEELIQRKQLKMPPFKHFGLLKLRGSNNERVKEASMKAFEILKENNKNQNIKVVSVNPSQPEKLRGNYYWQILVSSGRAEVLAKFLKLNLKKVSHSGIIVTVDIDPL